MSSIADIAKLRATLKASSSNSGYCVKQSEEAIKSLEAENFNLKLKLYMMESKRSAAQQGSESSFDVAALFEELEDLRDSREENLKLIESALAAIDKLEAQHAITNRRCYEQQVKLFKLKVSRISCVTFDDSYNVN